MKIIPKNKKLRFKSRELDNDAKVTERKINIEFFFRV